MFPVEKAINGEAGKAIFSPRPGLAERSVCVRKAGG